MTKYVFVSTVQHIFDSCLLIKNGSPGHKTINSDKDMANLGLIF
jgi:hypothetical protein